jgi:hypothetical protein
MQLTTLMDSFMYERLREESQERFPQDRRSWKFRFRDLVMVIVSTMLGALMMFVISNRNPACKGKLFMIAQFASVS